MLETWVVGADGLVGGILADAFDGCRRVVFRSPLAGEVALDTWSGSIREPSLIVNSSGFSVHPGLGEADYFRSHVDVSRRIAEQAPRGSIFLHVSSAAVYGGDTSRRIGPETGDAPDTFHVPEYARAKLASEAAVRATCKQRGVSLVVLRPSTLYRPGGRSMFQTFARFARRGVALRILPRDARHHFCGGRLFGAVARAAVARARAGVEDATYAVADPFTFTNRDVEAEMRSRAGRPLVPLPLPLGLVSRALRRGPRSSRAALDLRGRGNLLGYLTLDIAYDGATALRSLGLDAAPFGRDHELARTLDAVLPR